MNPMSAILTRLAGAPPAKASVFASVLTDNDFNGNASVQEMEQFCDAALTVCARPVRHAQKVLAIQQLKAFVGRQVQIRFPHCNSNVIVYQLVIRVLQPQRINQKRYGLCGPAHFAVLLARSQPADYVELALQFMERGAANFRGLKIQVAPEILNHRIPSTGMLGGFIPEADWVVAASLRNSTEDFPLSQVLGPTVMPTGSEGKYTGTHGKIICAWLRDAGYSQIAAALNFWKPE